MKVIGLFTGIGGIEEGFRRSELFAELLCESDPAADRVLRHRFPGICLASDIRHLNSLPRADVVTAGFPCQDLSQAGRTAGIFGCRSSVIGEVFRLLPTAGSYPEWLVLENVPFMLHLARGRAMAVITAWIEQCGYRWAYRTVDTRAFGLPQRRRRVLIVCSRKSDPRAVLFADDAGPPCSHDRDGSPRGFYWTEGRSGIGWARNAVPPLKGGSALGIPSSPAIWFPGRRFISTLDIRDAERLQGFRAGWTRQAAVDERSERDRWRLVGNAVSVPVAAWLAKRLLNPGEHDCSRDRKLDVMDKWPLAAWGSNGSRYSVQVSSWPVRKRYRGLSSFLRFNTVPLSVRASTGFRARAQSSSLTFENRFLDDVAHHIDWMQHQESLDNGRRVATRRD